MAQTIDPERLRQIRNTRQLTQDELAKKASLNKQTIYRLERDQKAIRSEKNLEQLASALGIDRGLTGETPIPQILHWAAEA